jgi:hypothetical protein
VESRCTEFLTDVVGDHPADASLISTVLGQCMPPRPDRYYRPRVPVGCWDTCGSADGRSSTWCLLEQ